MKTLISTLLLIPMMASAAQNTVSAPAEWMNLHPALDVEKPRIIELPNYLDHSEDIDIREALPVDETLWKLNTAQGSNRL